MIAQIWPNITTLTTCQIVDFQAPVKSSFQITFFLILLPMIECYKTNKSSKFHHDLIKIMKIMGMAVQIWLKMSIFSFFGSYPYFGFLP